MKSDVRKKIAVTYEKNKTEQCNLSTNPPLSLSSLVSRGPMASRKYFMPFLTFRFISWLRKRSLPLASIDPIHREAGRERHNKIFVVWQGYAPANVGLNLLGRKDAFATVCMDVCVRMLPCMCVVGRERSFEGNCFMFMNYRYCCFTVCVERNIRSGLDQAFVEAKLTYLVLR